MGSFFQIEYNTFKNQSNQLLRLNKHYLFSLFEMKHFRNIFPKLISQLPNKFKEMIKCSLPLEFLEHVVFTYEANYKKCVDSYKRRQIFELSLLFVKLHLKIKNHVQWKKTKTNLTRHDIIDFVKAQKTMVIITIHNKKQDFFEIEVLQTKEQVVANNKKQEQQDKIYTKRTMALVGKRLSH